MQKRILVKGKGVKFPRQTEIKRVFYVPIRKVVDHLDLPGFGSCPVLESTGEVDKSMIQIHTAHGWYTLEATPDGIRKKIRILREQEASLLDAIDKKIQDLQDERIRVLKVAWAKANVMTVKELTDKIE